MLKPTSLANLKRAALAAAGAAALAGADARASVRSVLLSKDAEPLASTMQVESIDEAARTATFVLTEFVPDQVGDRVLPEGGDLADFLRNPQFLWMHQQELPPIGKWLKLWIEDGKLKGTAYFTPPEIDEPGDPAHSFSERCWSLVKAGILNAVSIFFRIKEAEFNGEGLDVNAWTLLEASLVTVGMNPNALLDGKSAAALLEDRMPKGKALTEGNAGEGGNMATADDLQKCMKAMTEACSAMQKSVADHQALVDKQSKLVEAHGKALADAQAHAQKLAAVHADLQSVTDELSQTNADNDPDNEAKKAAAELRKQADEKWTEAKKLADSDPKKSEALAREAGELHAKATQVLAKGGGAHQLSGSQLARAKAVKKAADDMIAAHNASGGTDAGKPDDDKDGKSAKSFEQWLASQTPEQLKAAAAEMAEQAIREQRGAID
jgi:hypothetical protein